MVQNAKNKPRPGLILLRILSVLFLVGPPVMVGVIWGWMALSGLSPQKGEIFDWGERAIVIIMGVGLLGLLAEFLILPILLNDRGTGRSDGGP